MGRILGFPPISTPDAHVLVLGSMPSVRSLHASEYYAHKGNAFWRIMGELFDAGWDKSYSERVRVLNNKGIAVWDVIKSCMRDGSGDLSIREDEPNDFQEFFERHPQIKKIGLNGAKAADSFDKSVKGAYPLQIILTKLPSTSPANARYTFDKKLDVWRAFMSL